MSKKSSIAIIGGGPAGLMAAETLAKAGQFVTVYERKASLGRKFLLAGRGGLNLTHSEPLDKFVTRYNEAKDFISPLIDQFLPEDLQKWCEDLGEPVFTGSSGRIFPKSLKASPLLRAWIRRLNNLDVEFKMQRQWNGWDNNGDLNFISPDHQNETANADAVLLALGGASWPNLGSDGSWTDILRQKNINISDLKPANCGFNVKWSDVFREKFSGHPLKSITLSFKGKTVPGELMIDRNGIEGGVIYAISYYLRNSIDSNEEAVIYIDLRPTLTKEAIEQKLQTPRRRQTFSTYLEKALGLNPLSINLLREVDMDISNYTMSDLASLIKAVPVIINGAFPIQRAISSAGGINLNELDKNLMLKKIPGVFAAGEMLDWEAPTGGYLLQASFATGFAAAQGILNYVNKS